MNKKEKSIDQKDKEASSESVYDDIVISSPSLSNKS